MSWQVGLYVVAVLLPLASFLVQILGIRRLGRVNAYIATGAIGIAFLLSLVGFITYFATAEGVFAHHGEIAQEIPGEHGEHEHADDHEHAAGHGHRHEPLAWTGGFDWVSLGAAAGVPPVPALKLRLAFYIDNLTVIMFLMVTFIATLIHLYSMGYMHDDPRYPRFFAYLSLFCFSMLGLVASANVFMVFTFWELVGVCSYLLIGFWYEDKKNSDAANKAFIVNRVGDVGMLVGLGILWSCLGTFDIHEINRGLRDDSGSLNAAGPAGSWDTVVQFQDADTGKVILNDYTGLPRTIPLWALGLAGLGIFAGCVGKSAQTPLHVWLPDAMAGPTPVSALIHAATMVAAGVYLVGRFYPLFTSSVLLYIAYTGGVTLFIAATIAMVQTDYKKVLAYSTVSQLGFMMLALGVGGWAAGLFHLLTHAFFKALLFLGAGSVYHAVHTYEMPVLGGLRRKMPITATTMLIGTLAISGVPFFSGFYSKDAILAAALYRVFNVDGGTKHILLFILPALGATITAFYMFRMWLLVFAGSPRGNPKQAHGHGHGHGHDDHHHGNPVDHAHESEPIMAWPLIALAIPAVFVGWPWPWQLGLPFWEPVLEQMLTYGEPLRGNDLWSMHYFALAASAVIAAAGIAAGFLFYAPAWPVIGKQSVPTPLRRRFKPEHVAHRFPRVHNFLVHKWYFDEAYNLLFVRPTLSAAQLLSTFDKRIVDGLVNSAAWITEVTSRLSGLGDKIAIDGLVNLTARSVYELGGWSRLLQTGRLRNYLMVVALGLVFLSMGVFAWVRGS